MLFVPIAALRFRATGLSRKTANLPASPKRLVLSDIRIPVVPIIDEHPHVEGFAAFGAFRGVFASDAFQPESDAALGAVFENILFVAEILRLLFKDRDDFVPDP